MQLYADGEPWKSCIEGCRLCRDTILNHLQMIENRIPAQSTAFDAGLPGFPVRIQLHRPAGTIPSMYFCIKYRLSFTCLQYSLISSSFVDINHHHPSNGWFALRL